jgi:quercetin dioxygenase-like cupin family protein
MSRASVGGGRSCDLKVHHNESELPSTSGTNGPFFPKPVPICLLFIALSAVIVGPNAAWSQGAPPTSTVTMAPVSKDSETIAGEPELYLSTPEPEVSSAIFTFPPGSVSQWMIHPAPVYIYVLEGTLVVEFEDGSHQSFHAGQAFLQCRSKWHRGRNDGPQTTRFLAVFFGAKGVPDVVHPAAGPIVDTPK